ncbi:hypothetical protein EPN90_00310 [Patescibacteria group bacterium]|nr:MAG: hypothetical protein EPN90_00310 [Patescibacteria group bacterium]
MSEGRDKKINFRVPIFGFRISIFGFSLFAINALLFAAPALAVAPDPPSCTAEDRGIVSFSCPGTPTGNICGAAPNYYCAAYGSEPVCGANQQYDCNSCACTCKSGYINCSGTCQTPKPNTCSVGQTFDPCTGTCSGYAYALVGTPLLSTPQSGHMNIGGDIKFAGDLLAAAGKAIRVDSAANTSFNFGNWGGGGFTLGVVGTVTAQQLCLPGAAPTGGCITTWPSGGGGGGAGTVTSITAGLGLTASPADPITGAGTLNIGAGTGITVAADSISINPAFTGLTGYVKKIGDTMTGSLVISGGASDLSVGRSGAFGGYSPDSVWKITTPNAYFGDGVKGTIIGAGGGQNAGDITTDGVLTIKQEFKLIPGAAAGLVLTSRDSSGFGVWMSGYCANGGFDHITASSYKGAEVGGYNGANSKCGADRYICTPDEIVSTVGCYPTSLPASGNAWVANGGPGYTSPASNDCIGWSSSADTSYGDFWKFNGTVGGSAYATSCSQSLPIACCK